MDAWQRDIHAAVIRVLEAAGAGVALPGSAAGCCGALHSHAGLVADARRLAARTMTAFPGDAPILVDSAGCGAALAAFGHLLGSAAAVAFSARVLDVHEWLAPRIEGLALRATDDPAAARPHVAIQDACHLRHVQRAHQHVRTVLAPFATLAELDDDGLCCGAGGAYSVMHPEMAGDIRLRKLAAIGRTGAPIVASANPGCALHLAAAGLDVRHPLEIVDEAISPHAPHRREAGRGR
jgi:glycolate oxidase iron-sulfur subunit